ncbi:hypothetical protein PROFUN_05217 [Planoprotostelium fungivorum]|uniref:Uncharacterized protein n=1 Tax=Planoprotostelium fungivorum TaxID=1890364 RepID=A0A2P6NRI5_9EUKA|nr:hypothetical protein PROFUN_05217 [Planoprotostelium fungivorum]
MIHFLVFKERRIFCLFSHNYVSRCSSELRILLLIPFVSGHPRTIFQVLFALVLSRNVDQRTSTTIYLGYYHADQADMDNS